MTRARWRSNYGLPIGSAVREIGSGKLGKVVRAKRHDRLRGFLPVLFDGERAWRLVQARSLSYVAQHYESAKEWEQRTAANTESNEAAEV